jgi:RNA polymerase sigma factor (sigma-70 family)
MHEVRNSSMEQTSDQELLHNYAAHGDHAAFESLVQRHVHLVYSAALRQTGNHAMAQDVSQAVFVILARKAASLRRETVLAGWLFRAVRYAAMDARKIEARRQLREEEAAQMQLADSVQEPELDWEQLAPLLDEAIAGLGAKDRNAVLLRFFEKKGYGEIGASVGGNENAARVRVVRAVEKLRAFFKRRGVTVSAVVLSGLLLSNAVQAVPAGLVEALAGSSRAGGGSVVALVQAVLRRFWWRRLLRAASAVALLLLLGSITFVGIRQWQFRQAAGLAQAHQGVRDVLFGIDRAFMNSDSEGFVARIYFRNAADEQFRPVLRNYINAESSFRQEMRRTFNVQQRTFDATFRELCVGQPPVTINFIGLDRAATNVMTAKYPFHLIKVAEGWKWDLFGGLSNELRAERLAVLAKKTKVLETLTAQVRNGESTNVTEILQFFEKAEL